MGSPGNRSGGAEGAVEPPWAELLPCDERRCSPFPLRALVPVTAVCLGLFAVGPGATGTCGPPPTCTWAAWLCPTCSSCSGSPSTSTASGASRPWVPLALRGRGLHLRHAAAHDCAQRRALPRHLSPAPGRRPRHPAPGPRAHRCALGRGAALRWALLLSGGRRAGPRPLRSPGLQRHHTAHPLAPHLAATPRVLGSSTAVPAVGTRGGGGRRAVQPRVPAEPRTAGRAAHHAVSHHRLLLPAFLCLSVLYGLIGRELWRSRGRLRGSAASGREKGHLQTVRVLLVVVLAFSLLVAFPRGQNYLHKYRSFLQKRGG
nr:motilin receptor [Camelus dromedarius]